MQKLKELFPLLAIIGCLLGARTASGLTFFVNQTEDSTRETEITGALLKKIMVRGAIIEEPSLRGAILTANRRGGFNTILLKPKTYQLSIAGADEDEARTGDLDITRGNLTITVVGKGNATINSTGLGDRVFQVFTNAQLTLLNLVITGGEAPQAGEGSFYRYSRGAEAGGAIYNSGKLTLNSCIITNNSSGRGNYNPGNGGGRGGADGGGVYNSGTLFMNRCSVQKNSCGKGFDGAWGGNGGGVRNDGYCAFRFCAFSHNSSGAGGPPAGNAIGFAGWGGDGGAIYNNGTMVFNNCIISDNFTGAGSDGSFSGWGSVGSPAASGGNGGNGAGIYNSGYLRLFFSTVDGNTNGTGGSGGRGGNGGSGAGIYNTAIAILETCTVSRNFTGNGGADDDESLNFAAYAGGGSGGSGGGVCNIGVLSVNACTIVTNSTGNGGDGDVGWFSSGSNGGNGGDGGGIDNKFGGTCTNFSNNLTALNFVGLGGIGGLAGSPLSSNITTNGVPGSIGSGPDLSGDFTSRGFNLIGIADGSNGFTNGLRADQIGSLVAPIDPLIGPLQMNGGPTPTHALRPGSPAIDQGKSFGAATDQRGFPRPRNFSAIANAPGGDGSDIGAFEFP